MSLWGVVNGYARDTQHDTWSVTKSFTASLTGIAIQQGFIALDDTLAQHVNRFEEFANVDDRKRSNCSGAVTVFGNIIASRSGRKLEAFAVDNLSNPLDMSSVRWLGSPLGVTNASSAIQLRPRDAAKFGSLFLNGGRWNGVQVVPQAWVERSAQGVTAIRGESYGWLWWKSSFHVRGVAQPGMYASGNGGNLILVVPSERLVVVITASNCNRASPSMNFFRDSILPTIQEAHASHSPLFLASSSGV